MSTPNEQGETGGTPVLEKVTGILFKEKNRIRLALLGSSLSLFLLSLFVVCLMPGPRPMPKARDEIIERRIVQVLCGSLLVICPVAVVGVCLKHPSVNNAVVMFVAGVGSGCVCALSFMMIGVNIMLTFFDIVRGKFRLDLMEMFAINVLVIALTAITYFQTSLSKELYSVYVENERNSTNTNTFVSNGTQEVSGGATNGRAAKSSRTTGSYNLSSANYDRDDYNFY